MHTAGRDKQKVRKKNSYTNTQYKVLKKIRACPARGANDRNLGN